ncbi:MAG: hypothetical protein KF886_06130 [Candidatus Hydrogenedentes bacterium]|nr:hypothetical protein [Candidatus Hydrogenedentota bacterium]
MHILTQRRPRGARRISRHIVPLLAAFALPACLQPDSGEPLETGAPDHPIARPPALSVEHPAPRANLALAPTPLDPWVVAHSLDEFHAIWTARFEHASADHPAEQHLLPYADALEHHGAAWGIAPRDGIWMYVPARQAAYSVPDGAHTRLDPAKARDGLAPDPDYDATTVRVAYQGATLRLRGPLVAASTCAKCHDFKPGALVGELVYEFTEIADD